MSTESISAIIVVFLLLLANEFPRVFELILQ